jgi:hypothetical protein
VRLPPGMPPFSSLRGGHACRVRCRKPASDRAAGAGVGRVCQARACR